MRSIQLKFQDFLTSTVILLLSLGGSFSWQNRALAQGATGSLPSAGLKLHLEAESNSVEFASGSKVRTWLDQSGNGSHLVASGDPRMRTGVTPSGAGAITLDGVGDKLELLTQSSPNALPSGARNRTVFSVVRYLDTKGVDAGVVYGKPNANRAFGLVARGSSDGRIGIQGFGNSFDLSSSEQAVGSGWLVQAAVLRNGEVSLYKNGSLLASKNQAFATRTNSPQSRLVIGQEIGGAGYSKMQIAAVIVYDRALSQIEYDRVQSYLNAKYFMGSTNEEYSLSGFSKEVIATGLNAPISLQTLPDGRLLVLQKGGDIMILNPNNGATSLYMRLGNVDSAGEKGLLDIAIPADFNPNRPNKAYFYLYYTPASPRRARVARFSHQERSGGLTSRGDSSSEVEIWTDTEGYLSCCHFGGGLTFGPDEKLWLSTSDKFTSPNQGEGPRDDNLSQDLTSAGGKILRFNPDGSVPDGSDGWPANPFISTLDDDPGLAGSQDYNDYIWAWGLRNPFRSAWDLSTGRLFVAEVGGNVQSIASEDLHVVTLDRPKVNFGWPYFEGTQQTQVLDPNGPYAPTHSFGVSGAEAPIFSYPHNGATASITGGQVYRGNQFPAEWQGVYFYGDSTRNELRYLRFRPNGSVLGSFPFMDDTEFVVHISEGLEGELYLVQLTGDVVRVQNTASNQPPRVTNLRAQPSQSQQPTRVRLTAVLVDGDNDSLSYTWHFGDGTSATRAGTPGAVAINHFYQANGTYRAYLEVSDGRVTNASNEVEILIGNRDLPPVISSFEGIPSIGPVPLKVRFLATVSDPENQPLDYRIVWGDGRSTPLRNVPITGRISTSHRYNSEGNFQAQLLVSDRVNADQVATTSITVGDSQLPPVVDGMVVLLEAEIKVGLADATTVSSWLDGSGRGNSLLASGNPQLIPQATPSGKPSIYFDGSGDKLERKSPSVFSGLPTGNADRTVIAVLRYHDMKGFNAGVVYGTGRANRTFGITADPNSGNLAVQGWGGRNDRVSSDAGVGSGWVIQTVSLRQSSVSHYKNGSQIDTWQHTYNTDLVNNSSKLSIGGEIKNLGTSELEVAAILVYDRALTNIERREVEAYLRAKYL